MLQRRVVITTYLHFLSRYISKALVLWFVSFPVDLPAGGTFWDVGDFVGNVNDIFPCISLNLGLRRQCNSFFGVLCLQWVPGLWAPPWDHACEGAPKSCWWSMTKRHNIPSTNLIHQNYKLLWDSGLKMPPYQKEQVVNGIFVLLIARLRDIQLVPWHYLFHM